MLYTVAEISELVDFSKVTIYNKINLLKSELKDCIHHKQGVMYINDEGLLIIKKDLGLIDDKEDLNQPDDFTATNTAIDNDLSQFKDLNTLVESLKDTVKTGNEDYINSLLQQIDFLKSELEKKDHQINTSLRLMENNQILLKEGKEKIIELESKDHKENRKSFFSWFRR